MNSSAPPGVGNPETNLNSCRFVLTMNRSVRSYSPLPRVQRRGEQERPSTPTAPGTGETHVIAPVPRPPSAARLALAGLAAAVVAGLLFGVHRVGQARQEEKKERRLKAPELDGGVAW